MSRSDERLSPGALVRLAIQNLAAMEDEQLENLRARIVEEQGARESERDSSVLVGLVEHALGLLPGRNLVEVGFYVQRNRSSAPPPGFASVVLVWAPNDSTEEWAPAYVAQGNHVAVVREDEEGKPGIGIACRPGPLAKPLEFGDAQVGAMSCERCMGSCATALAVRISPNPL